ncbi:MAG: Rne/Rng family ribonuclease, partial [Dongia sp.]
VAVVDGRKLEEFDVEIAGRRPLKGNIYLAKVTRVEPSLQACFVEYGGNRHGFLAFSEIHPDYHRIPIADREALIRETRAAIGDDDHDEPKRGRGRARSRAADDHGNDHEGPEASGHQAHDPEGDDHEGHDHDDHGHDDHGHDDQPHDQADDADHDDGALFAAPPSFDASDQPESNGADHGAEHEPAMPLAVHHDILRQDIPLDDSGAPETGAENAGSDAELPQAPQGGELIEVAVPQEAPEALGTAEPAREDDPEVDEENARRRRQRALRRYKIQEVIKRRQILLVQVTKEERGNKGAALTTYLSLAGRYCVLMPNTDRGGGISRRITSLNDRKRLKGIVDDLDVPEGMAVIVRTAGSERSKPEVKRDFEYLLRLWDEIRETTLKSSAPALIYEEASLIKRSIRDLYTRDMGDIVVAGVDGYTQAKSFMRMLTPSHAKRIQLFRDPSTPLFQKFQVESQLAAIHNPIVHLRSGGYIVINQTEALVAVDVNSGRATKERNIEETALKTNSEAAEEIARQLRLRDLAGLIVIDFIDMEESRNNNAVERRLKDSLRNDRARIQVGRISSFGLLEMSRQRLHPSLQEASTEICPHCRGSGRIRSVDSTALHVLRMVEEEITKTFSPGVAVFAPTAVALYILNQKRMALSQLEMRRGVRIYINGDDSLTPPDYRLERIKQLAPGEELPPATAPAALPTDLELEVDIDMPDEVEEETETQAESEGEAQSGERESGERGSGERGEAAEAGGDEEGGRGRRRRRRRRGRGNRFNADEFTESSEAGEPAAAATAAEPAAAVAASPAEEIQTEGAEAEAEGAEGGGEEGDGRRRRRRGRRGGRRRSRRGQEGGTQGAAENGAESTDDVADGEQPGVPDDSDALPPQWRAPETERPTEPVMVEPRVEPRGEPQGEPRGEPQATPVERDFPAYPAHEAVPQQARAPEPAPEPVSSPVKVIEIGAAEEAAADDASDAGADQGQRRGWWRRLIE